jgi:hypothetical protein
MSNDIRDIIERLAILEGRVTPTTVKSGLNPQQKSVPQLPALFKPKHISVLGAKEDPEHPMHDYMVGASESVEHDDDEDYFDPTNPTHFDMDDDEEVLEEAKVDEEKLLDKVKKSLTDYLTSVADQYKDDSISKKAKDKDLGERAADKDLVAKEVNEDPTEEEPANTDEVPTAPVVSPTYSVSAPGAVKTYTMEDGRICEIHGDEATGFAIRHGNRSMPSRFKTIDEASLALEMYQARCRKSNEASDYVDEA